jgi:hypothetical protein
MTAGLTLQDTRTDAREIKCVVDLAAAARIRDWARRRLTPDPHGSGPHLDEYRTASLYFDTDALDVFHRRGSFGRSKYRIRRYGSSDVVFLERKMRTKALLSKRRTIVALEGLTHLETDRRDGWAGDWFGRRIDARRLHVKCQVWYHRTARVGQSPYGAFRLTVDDTIETRPASGAAFQPLAGVPALAEAAIVELKFIHEMPAIFKHLVEEFGLQTRAISKYRLAMTALGERERVEVVHA